jgi:hypothetical protein
MTRLNEQEMHRLICEGLEYSLDTKLQIIPTDEWVTEIRGFVRESGLNIADWPIEYFGKDIREFTDALIRKNETDGIFHRDFRKPIQANFAGGTTPLCDQCTWPFCNVNGGDNLQKDHIIPKSKMGEEVTFISSPEKNLMWLCPYHNRMKTDSLELGLLFAFFRKKGYWK